MLTTGCITVICGDLFILATGYKFSLGLSMKAFRTGNIKGERKIIIKKRHFQKSLGTLFLQLFFRQFNRFILVFIY
jgi:hypothetical protein